MRALSDSIEINFGEHCNFVKESIIISKSIIKEKREYRTSLYIALKMCGESHAWNANNLRIRTSVRILSRIWRRR